MRAISATLTFSVPFAGSQEMANLDSAISFWTIGERNFLKRNKFSSQLSTETRDVDTDFSLFPFLSLA